MKKIAIIQSSYIPWKGYFDIINAVDEFILYDTVQYTRRDWRNRNKIMTSQGAKWLTIPVVSKHKYFQKIADTQIVDDSWCSKHWAQLHHAYRKAPHFSTYEKELKTLYQETLPRFTHLSDINRCLIQHMCHLLGISTPLLSAQKLGSFSTGSKGILDICQLQKATSYLSGPSAKSYLDEDDFKKSGIEIDYFDYSQYLVYPQLGNDFTHEVSIVDLLFNIGPKASQYLTSM